MADVKSDQVKQSIDNLEKYHLFTEGKLKLFIHKEFDQCGSLLRKNILDGEMYHLLAELPLTLNRIGGGGGGGDAAIPPGFS